VTNLEQEVIRLKRRVTTLEQELLRLERQNQDIRGRLEQMPPTTSSDLFV